MNQVTSERLSTLDALRGVAAILVVAFHGSEAGFRPVPCGYLAVDFFFVLSGLVVTRAYAHRLDRGLSFLAFAKLRLVRLYPLFALGLLIDTTRAVANVLRGHAEGFDLPAIATTLMRGLVMLPSDPRWEMLFRLNSPAWSLAFEILVNAVFASILFRLRSAVLAVVAGGTFAVLVVGAASRGSFNMGAMWNDAFPGMFRALWGFTAGMLIARLPSKSPAPSWAVLLPVGVLVAVTLMPPNLWAETLCIGLVMPMLVHVGGHVDPPPVLMRAAKILGEISYPMYALHWPLIYFFRAIGRSMHLPAPLTMLLAVALIAVIGLGVSRFLEIPIRRAISRKLDRVAFARP